MADRKIWDPHTGECLHTLQHTHIVKSVAFPQQASPTCVATGSLDKKLHIFDITQSISSNTGTASPNGSPTQATTNGSALNATSAPEGFEIGPGVHTAPIKSVVWMTDYNILTTAAEDKTLRWWDLRSRHPIATFVTEKPISSCELNTLPTTPASTSSPAHSGDAGLVAVAAGNTCYFFFGDRPGALAKSVTFDHDVASVAVNVSEGRFVTGGVKDTWVRVWDWDGVRKGEVENENSKNLIEVQKGHHGPIWSISYSPDGKLYATGSEDGTIKLWKACKEQYGLWRV
jgi:serine-threonine kinase receptor-associated protein